jgi:hypothetical protein
MKCKIYECENPADYPFPCCNIDHGMYLKKVKEALTTPDKNQLMGWSRDILNDLESKPEQLKYYQSII